jgi:hypothetical protein
VIQGEAEGGGGAVIACRRLANDRAPASSAVSSTAMPSRWPAVLDRLLTRRRMAAASAEAPRRLKLILERAQAEPPVQPV